MPELIAPTVAVAESFRAAMAEFQSEGRGQSADDSMIGAEIREWQPVWAASSTFSSFLSGCCR